MSTAAANSSFGQFVRLSQMPMLRQLGFMVLLAGAIALGSAVVLWSRTPAYSALYADMSAQDSSEVIAALEQQGIEYRIAAGSGIVTVPSDRINQVRLQLAGQGLPRAAAGGYAILDQEQSLGTSNFIEQARYNRALEQELVATIELIRAVREARVHLSIPRQSSFLRNSRKPTASVMLDIIGGQSLSDTQLAGILHLVATSVAGLETDKVSIVDQNGNLLSRRSGGEYGGDEHIRFTRRIEEDYVGRILDILTPIVGEGNVRAQVSADVDYTYVETTEEAFNPETRTVRSEQTSEERSGTGPAAPVVPGALAAEPPDALPLDANAVQTAAVAETGRMRTNATRNYELDRTISHIRTSPGSIRRLSVAVLVNLAPDAGAEAAPDPARLERLAQLVKDSIGFDEARGDSVNLISEQFSGTSFTEDTVGEIPLWQQPWVAPVVKQALAGVVVLLLIFAVLRPALKTVVAAPALARPAARSLRGAAPSDGEIPDDQVTLSDGGSPRLVRATPGKSEFDENLGLVQNLVEREPVRAARMIKEWVAND